MSFAKRRTIIRVSAAKGLAAFTLLSASAFAAAAESPAIIADETNPVPRCVTPQRLTAFLKGRNPRLDPRFDKIADAYVRIGKELGVRYDYAFYQMIAETGALSFQGAARARLVKPEQNNFAGIDAQGSGSAGESFPNMETGVRAHLQHIALYAGVKVDAPVAERTRKVQEWNILAQWQQSLGGPVTFEAMAHKWTKPTAVYASLIENQAAAFRGRFCANETEPPVAQAPERPRGQDLAKRAPDVAKAEGQDRRSALGAAGVAKQQQPPINIINREPLPETAPTPPQTNQRVAAVVIPKAAPPPAAAPPVAQAPKVEPPAARPVQPVAAPGAAATALPRSATQPSGPVPGGKCRVWTASYGGNRGMIVRWLKDGIVNFTVIDVNQGAETKEAQSFINGYTKDGAIVGSFQTQAQALDKAFEYCPEG
ncbi:MAG: hypothetical protein RL291_1534 [Pseudomonadota bacterium]|jgi:hypothetical protein